MIFSTILAMLLVAAAPQGDAFKKEKAALQQAVDTTAATAVARVLQQSKATYLEGYGVVVTLEVALATPPTPFGAPLSAAEVRAAVTQRRRDLEQKLSAFVTSRVVTMQSIAATESLAVVIHILNTTPGDVPNLPGQIVLSAKKDSPQQVIPKEF
jgi:hypothetical protein